MGRADAADRAGTAFLTDLGFVIPDELDDFVDDTAAQAYVLDTLVPALAETLAGNGAVTVEVPTTTG